MKPLKIGMFTDSFFPIVGGTEYAVLGLTQSLLKENEVFVCAPNAKNVNDECYNFDVLRVKAFKAGENLVALPSLDRKIGKVLDNRDLDIIHCHSVSGLASLAISTAKKKNIPLVFTVHTKFWEAFYAAFKNKFIVNILIRDMVKKLNKADLVITVCHDMKNQLAKYGYKKQVVVVNNGCQDFSAYDSSQVEASGAIEQLNKQFNLAEDDFVCLFVGRISKLKNIMFSFKALELVKKSNPKFKFVVVGGGAELKTYQKYVQKSSIKDNVIFTGKLQHDELSKFYARGNLFLFPSTFDNDPLTVIEASHYSMPCLTLKNCGASERIVDGQNGFVAEHSLNAFAEKIKQLMENPEIVKSAGQQAFKTIPSTWQQSADNYMKYYLECIDKKQKAD